MLKYLIAYVAAAIVFLGLDALWLSRVALDFYRRELGSLLLDKPNLTVAAVFYLLFVAGLVFLAVIPALTSGNWTTALVNGAVLGLVAYGTYDITNLSTLKGWSIPLTATDIAWGTALSSVSAVAGYFAASWASSSLNL